MSGLSDLEIGVVREYDVAGDVLVVFLSVSDALDGAMITLEGLEVLGKGIHCELLLVVGNVLGIVEANVLPVFLNCVIEKVESDRDIERWDVEMYCCDLVSA